MAFKLDYFNSASAKFFVRLLFTLEELHEKGYDVSVVWYYEESDELIKERGEAIRAIVELPFIMQKYTY